MQSAIPVSAQALPQSRDVPILLYHSVSYTPGTYHVTPEKLRSDIYSLKNAGYTPVLFSDLINFVYNGTFLPEKPVIISFDDGYKNNYDTLLPMALQDDFKFEVFGVAGGIGVLPTSMTWAEAAHLDEYPVANLGCHTFNMHNESDMSYGTRRKSGISFNDWEHLFRTDLRCADDTIFRNISRHPTIFAYPYGAFSAEADKILRESGYIVSVTTEPGINTVTSGDKESLYLMMRISMDGRSESAIDVINQYMHIHSTYAINNAKAEVAQILYVSRKDALCRIYGDAYAGMEADLSYLNAFVDTKYLDEESARIIALCIENCQINGFEDLTIRPNHYLTRGELAVLIARHCGYDGRKAKYIFNDANNWNFDILSWCLEMGYMKGYNNTTFGVDDFLTYEQLDLICQRLKSKTN